MSSLLTRTKSALQGCSRKRLEMHWLSACCPDSCDMLKVLGFGLVVKSGPNGNCDGTEISFSFLLSTVIYNIGHSKKERGVCQDGWEGGRFGLRFETWQLRLWESGSKD